MKIVTFYSYKGGVGRSMCLANVGVQLAQWGHKVLLVDWDIEAPGLERYFVSENFKNLEASDSKFGIDLKLVKKTPGLIDLLSDPESCKWEKTLIPISIPDAPAPVHLITAGKRDDAYFQRVRDFNVDKFYTEHNGGDYIESLREAWSKQYDFVLIDSRTGITEINGICTIQMPDLVVLLFTATNQGFEGTLDIAQRADKAQQKLPYNRFKLMFLPVLTRVESSEFELTRGWIRNFAERLRDIYKYWLPSYINREQFMELTKIPHFPFFSFGEELAVVKQGTSDPSGMGYAYANIASLIANHLEKAEEFFEKREVYVNVSLQKGYNLVNEVKLHIGKQEIIPAIEALEAHFITEDSRDDLNMVIILKARYHRLLEDYYNNRMSRGEFYNELDKIMRAVLSVADTLGNVFSSVSRSISKPLTTPNPNT